MVTSTGIVRARRRARVNALRATFGAGLSYDDACVEEFSLLTELVVSNGGGHRAHALDRMIAATARAHGLVLVTRNIKDFSQIQDAIATDPMGKLVFKISSWSSSRATLAQPGVIARTYVACCYHANHACPSRPNRQLARRIT